MKPLYLLAEIYPHPEKIDEARQLFQELIEQTLKEPGCLIYELVSEHGSDHWIMIEKWESLDAWEKHMETDHVKLANRAAQGFTRLQTKLRFLDPVEDASFAIE